jgi:hypothetical protein
MPRHWLSRAFAALVLLWFAVVTTEPAALHLCPVHGAPAAAGATAEHVGDGHSHHGPSQGGEQTTCTCIGDCSAGGFSVALSSPAQPLVVVAPESSEGPRLETGRPRIPAAAFLLPYANGPPGDLVLA